MPNGERRMAARALASVVLAAWLTGCTATHSVSRSDADALAGLNRDLSGKTVEIVHRAARERGTRLRVHRDSTRWLAESTRRSVPTASVEALVVDPRASNVRLWAGAGAAFFGLLTALTCAEGLDGLNDELTNRACLAAVPLAAVGGAATFGAYAAIGSERVEYRLVE
jgi:hypothetical protein